VLGASEPAADVELLAFAQQLLVELGVADRVVLQLNTLGDAETRGAWRAALVAHFSKHLDVLSEESRERLAKNPLRILDSKAAGDKALVADAPRIDDFMSTQAGAFFESVQRGLEASGVAYVRDAALVRGFDYYRHTAFEFVTDALGAQGTVIGGGRYDGLIGMMGGPETPAVGWAAGIERLALLAEPAAAPTLDVAVVAVDEAGALAALGLLADLRRAGISAEQGWRGNVKKKMERAGKAGAGLVVLVGADELAAGEATLKDMASGEQRRVALSEAVRAVRARLAGGGLWG
jgi:histidyl-tRNA synthetase